MARITYQAEVKLGDRALLWPWPNGFTAQERALLEHDITLHLDCDLIQQNRRSPPIYVYHSQAVETLSVKVQFVVTEVRYNKVLVDVTDITHWTPPVRDYGPTNYYSPCDAPLHHEA